MHSDNGPGRARGKRLPIKGKRLPILDFCPQTRIMPVKTPCYKRQGGKGFIGFVSAALAVSPRSRRLSKGFGKISPPILKGARRKSGLHIGARLVFPEKRGAQPAVDKVPPAAFLRFPAGQAKVYGKIGKHPREPASLSGFPPILKQGRACV